MVEMQFADFVSEGMTQIINNLAKSHIIVGDKMPTVVRMPTGAGFAGPFHSQSNEAWFFKTPGLKLRTLLSQVTLKVYYWLLLKIQIRNVL